MSWMPEQMPHQLEYSSDMLNWIPAEGELGSNYWSGSIPEASETTFFRVLTEEMFP